MEYGALEADVGAGAGGATTGLPGGGFCPSPLTKEVVWTYAVNDADHPDNSPRARRWCRPIASSVRDAAGAEDLQLVTIRLQGSNDAPTAAAVALEVDAGMPMPACRRPRQHPLAGSLRRRRRRQRRRSGHPHLRASRPAEPDLADANVTVDTNGLTLDFGNGDTLTVAHVSALHEDDLLFS